MTWQRVWDVLKWVLAALAAGFIGHFGRILAERIVHRRTSPSVPSSSASPPEVELEKKRIKEQAKLEKKRIKAEIKKQKKRREE